MKLFILRVCLIAVLSNIIISTVSGFTQLQVAFRNNQLPSLISRSSRLSSSSGIDIFWQKKAANRKSGNRSSSSTSINMVNTRGLEKREEGATPLRKLEKSNYLWLSFTFFAFFFQYMIC